MTVLKMPKYPCVFCKKNEATQLCDFVVGYAWTSMKNEKGRMIGRYHETCDNEICKYCAIKTHSGHEFCPSCNKMHQYIEKNHDKRRGKIMIDVALGKFEPIG